MFENIKSNLSIICLIGCIITAGYFVLGCANRGGGPQGGAIDHTPPVPLKSKPENGALNYTKNRIEILFDENVLIDNAFDNVVVSPPQLKPAVVKALGKRVLIDLTDSLKANTTYTIDFGKAIVDNNEKNALTGYSFSFSTSSYIDTLQMSGVLIDASNLNPIPNIFIGIHHNLSDTAFNKLPFDRITKTDEQGTFTIRNIKEGSYKIYALEDIGGNFIFDQPNERIAFLDSVFTPTFEIITVSDTIWRDSVAKTEYNSDTTIHLVDSVKTTNRTKFIPDSIILQAFTEEFHRQYLVKSERKDKYQFSLFFNDINDSLPKVEALNFPFEDAVFIQSNDKKDSITYWLKDSLAWNNDSLKVKITYLKSDSLNNLVAQTDTLNFNLRKSASGTKKQNSKQNNDKPKQDFLNINTNISTSFNYFDRIILNFVSPTFFDSEKNLVVEQKVDTNWVRQKIEFSKDDSIGLRYYVTGNWKPTETYRLVVDSAMFYDIYGKVNNKLSANFTCRSKDTYASLTLEMGFHTDKEVVQLLDKDDKILKTQVVTKDIIKFENLNAGVYYARLFVDENQNGKWDTGKYADKQQPEATYYYPYYFELREMWDVEEYWDYLEFPLLQQKPNELIKIEQKKK
jgi:uncharacterized protein (DUF2141 family)